MQNRIFQTIVALSTTNATSLLNCAVSSLSGPTGVTLTQPYLIIRHIKAVNTSSSATTVSLFIGSAATAASGTEYQWSATSIQGNASLEDYPYTRLSSSQYLCGGASAANVSLLVEFEVGFS